MKYLELDPTKYYYNIDGHLMEFDSTQELDEWCETHYWGAFSLVRGPEKKPRKKHRKRKAVPLRS